MELGHLTVEGKSLQRHWFKHNCELMGTAIRDSIMVFAGVIGAVYCQAVHVYMHERGRNATNLFIRRNLAEQVGQDRCVTNVAPGDL